MKSRRPLLDPAARDWVMVSAGVFSFEPIGAEFLPKAAGSVVVTFGKGKDRHRGVEITWAEGVVSIWMPAGGRAFWLADSTGRQEMPWELRLQELDYERGRLL